MLTYNVFPDTYMYVLSDYILISILQLHLLVLRSLVVALIPEHTMKLVARNVAEVET